MAGKSLEIFNPFPHPPSTKDVELPIPPPWLSTFAIQIAGGILQKSSDCLDVIRLVHWPQEANKKHEEQSQNLPRLEHHAIAGFQICELKHTFGCMSWRVLWLFFLITLCQ